MGPTAVAFGLYLFGIGWRPAAWAGFAVQTGYLAYRGITLGRLPLIGVHDTLNFLSASFIAFALGVYFVMQNRGRFMEIVAAMSAFFSAMAMFQKPHASPLPPVLKSYWFELHVALSFFSYALFGIAAVLGVLYLRDRSDYHIERLQYKAVFVGYAFFSVSMIFGGVWAMLAWGTYWLWTPKELWTSLLWVYYGFYLHARLVKGWSGKPVAVLGIAGYALVLFTYLGVGLLMKSSHSF